MRKIIQYILIPLGIITFFLSVSNDHSGFLQYFIGVDTALLLVWIGLFIEERIKSAWQSSLAEHVLALRTFEQEQRQQSQQQEQDTESSPSSSTPPLPPYQHGYQVKQQQVPSYEDPYAAYEEQRPPWSTTQPKE
jgi:hypothetical protein